MRTLEFFEILTEPRGENIRVAWRSDGTEISLSEFRENVARLAAQLRRQPQTRFALCLNDAYFTAVAFFACCYAGKKIVLPGHTRSEQLREQTDFFDGVISDAAELRIDVPVILLPEKNDASPAPAPVEIFAGTARENFDATTVTFFTSGSAGTPKPNTKKIPQLEIENQVQAARWAEKIAGARIAGTTSHLHLYGLQFRVLLPLSRGVPFNASLVEYHEQLHAAPQPLALITSPAFLKRLDAKLPPLRCPFILSAGGFLPESVAREAAQILGVAPFEIFGSTEAGAVAWRDNACEQHWTPLPGVKISADSDGRLHLRSPFLADAGTLVTDDQIQINAAGTAFQLLGRLDRTIKIEEKRVALPEVERRLLEDPHVTDAAVIPLTLEKRTTLGAVLVLNDTGLRHFREQGKGKYLLALRARLRGKLEPVAIPRRIHVTAHIPTNTQGKRKTAELQALFATEPEHNSGTALPAELDFFGEKNNVRLTLRLDPELLWFKGHFEKYPILPGVTQLHWACCYAERFFPALGNFHRVETMKFKKPLKPGDTVTLELRHDRERRQLSFSYTTSDGTVASTGKMTFSQ